MQRQHKVLQARCRGSRLTFLPSSKATSLGGTTGSARFKPIARLATRRKTRRFPNPIAHDPFGAASQPHARQRPSPTEHAVAWQPNSPVGQPNGLGPPMLNYAAPPNPAAPTVGQGVAQTAADVAQALPSWPSVEEQRRMLQPLPGWQGTAVDAAKQWAEGVMMGTTAPGDAPGFSLDSRSTVYTASDIRQT